MRINDMHFNEDESRVLQKGRPCHVCGALTCELHLSECSRCTAMRVLLRDMRSFKRVVERRIPVVRSKGELAVRKVVKRKTFNMVSRLSLFACLILLAPLSWVVLV
jgi:hypothetical protein